MVKITNGEYNALVKIWNYSPATWSMGIQWRTIENLVNKELLEWEKREGGVLWFWLSDKGKKAMDEYPHLERIEKMENPNETSN